MGKRKNLDGDVTSSIVDWTQPMDKVLLDALLVEFTNDSRVDGSFTSQAYANVVNTCPEKLAIPLTKDNIKNCLKTLKRNFSEAYDLFGASGWGWNGVTQTFQNEYEVWDSLLEIKPEAKKWRNKHFPHFDLLEKLFAKDRAIGNHASTANEKRLHMTSSMGDSSDKTESNTEAETTKSTDSKKGKRKAFDNLVLDEISTIKQGLDNVAQSIREGNEVIAEGRPRFYTTQEVHDTLLGMELDVLSCRKAYRFLTAKQARVREIFGCPLEERKDYLMEMMLDGF